MTAEDMAIEMIKFINEEIKRQEKALHQLNQKKILLTVDQFHKDHGKIIGAVETLHAIARQVKNIHIESDDNKFMYKGKTR
jgi:hypothetical protein